MSGNIEYLKGKGFDANPQNINRNGRPRKQLAVILEEIENLGYKRPSATEVIEICGLMLSLTKEELGRISKGEDHPMIMRIIASRLLSQRDFETVEKILDRLYGKTINGGKPLGDNIVSIVIKDTYPITEEQEMKIIQHYLDKKNLTITTQ